MLDIPESCQTASRGSAYILTFLIHPVRTVTSNHGGASPARPKRVPLATREGCLFTVVFLPPAEPKNSNSMTGRSSRYCTSLLTELEFRITFSENPEVPKNNPGGVGLEMMMFDLLLRGAINWQQSCPYVPPQTHTNKRVRPGNSPQTAIHVLPSPGVSPLL